MESFIENSKKEKLTYDQFCEKLRNLSFNVLIKESKDYPELFLIWANQENKKKICMNNEDILQTQMNGVILKKDGFEVVCRSFDNYIDDIGWDSEYYSEDSKKRVETYEEGTFLRIFYHKEKWIVSSLKCINVEETFLFCKNKNFYDFFWEAGKNMDVDKLDKNFSYSFILKHRENRCGIPYNGIPTLVYCGKFDLRNWKPCIEKVYAKDLKKEEVDSKSDIVDIVELEFSTNLIEKEIERTDLSNKGIIVVLENGDRLSFVNKKFLEIAEIRGSNPNIKIRYIELDKEKRLKLIEYFPEFGLQKINEDIDKKALQIFKTYQASFLFKKIETSDIFKNIRNIVERVNSYSKEKKKPVTLKMCHEKLLECEPKELGMIMQWFPKNNGKK